MKALASGLLMIALCSGAAQARDNAITLYGGYRDGGGFADADSGRSLDLDGSGTGAIAIDTALDASRQLQWYLSQQKTTLSVAQPTAPGAPVSALPMTVTYLHVGGTYFFEGPIGRGPYVVGGLGATLFRPGLSGYSDELRGSLNLGVGYQLPLGEHVALRLEARGYFTAINSSGGLFCSGGCVVHIKADGVTQGELQFGLSFLY